ncbi:MAG TPA: hypothetical protein VK694_08095 [Verrucomicrobiae bacterium]|nr:hypothetical protein [Verrucomicrobiae bacterium]
MPILGSHPWYTEDRLSGIVTDEPPRVDTAAAARFIGAHAALRSYEVRTSEQAADQGWIPEATDAERALDYIQASRVALDEAVVQKPTRWDKQA